MAHSDVLVVQTAALTKVFRDFWGHQRVIAVDRLDLEVHSHEVFGLLGPNGSGKSTTIKLLLGLLFPTRGWAKVLGQPPGNIKNNYRIGYLPEESQLYPFLNARETLDFYGRLFGLPARQRRSRIDSLLDMVGLAGVARRPVGEFSKGMARRIGLAQALINDPELLILDEPTAGLDPIGTRQIKDLISQLSQRGKTVLLCSHLLADVEDVCDRIGILYGGQMQSLGSVNQLLAQTDTTQIRSPKLTAELIAKIEDIIRAQHHDYRIDAQTPRVRLEDFFLQTVAQAQKDQVQTSGAIAGSGLSDFLAGEPESPDSARQVIEQLTTGADSKPAAPALASAAADSVTPAPAAVTPDEDVRLDVIADLAQTSAAPDGSSQAVQPPEHRHSPPSAQPVDPDAVADASELSAPDVDRSLIDRLAQPSSGHEPAKPHADDEKPDANGAQEKT